MCYSALQLEYLTIYKSISFHHEIPQNNLELVRICFYIMAKYIEFRVNVVRHGLMLFLDLHGEG